MADEVSRVASRFNDSAPFPHESHASPRPKQPAQPSPAQPTVSDQPGPSRWTISRRFTVGAALTRRSGLRGRGDGVSKQLNRSCWRREARTDLSLTVRPARAVPSALRCSECLRCTALRCTALHCTALRPACLHAPSARSHGVQERKLELKSDGMEKLANKQLAVRLVTPCPAPALPSPAHPRSPAGMADTQIFHDSRAARSHARELA